MSGNPRPDSRTLHAAEATAGHIAALVGGATLVTTIDCAAFASEILSAQHPTADAALKTLSGASIAVIATPVYKASYTGLLKSFLDLYGPGCLAGVVAVPLVVSANPSHSLVGEVHLRPLLVELGAVVPTRSLALVEPQLADLKPAIDAWLVDAGPALLRTGQVDR